MSSELCCCFFLLLFATGCWGCWSCCCWWLSLWHSHSFSAEMPTRTRTRGWNWKLQAIVARGWGRGRGLAATHATRWCSSSSTSSKSQPKSCCLDYKIPQQKYMQRRQLVMLNQFMAAEFNGQPNMLTSNKIAEKKLNHKTYKTKFFNYNSFYFFMSFKRSKGRLLNFIVCNVKSDLPWQKRIAKFSLELKVI